MPVSPAFRPEITHLALGGSFYDPVKPADFPQTILRYRNDAWAKRTGLDSLSDAEWIAHFGRFEPLPGSLPDPLALRYHGHQFRSYNPHLGDGRGFLFAQLRDDRGRLLDLGTKGSGQTPYSRRGDGRLTLKGGVREVLATSMLEALGVDTSKSFSLVETGDSLFRNDEPSPTRAAVLVRLSHSHIRIGSFQRLLAMNAAEGVGQLLAHCVTHYAPEARRNSAPEEAAAFLDSVMRKTARTCARWLAAGFVHGVLNTDNINITGESFDYGPYRFLPHYDPGFTAAYFDETGLYAFGRQPDTIAWNLARLAETLLMIASREALEEVLKTYPDVFWPEMRIAHSRRLGLAPADDATEDRFSKDLFVFLQQSVIPFEGAMFDLYGGPARLKKAMSGERAAFYTHPAFEPVRAALEARKPAEAAKLTHPYFRRAHPHTLVYDEIEALWAPIAERDDWSAFYAKLTEIDLVRDAYELAE
ncbi:MAG: YdiU family protein [Rhizobiales bacterium]|nr:YdiU family protein [Hyphomicrobiales bacterium]